MRVQIVNRYVQAAVDVISRETGVPAKRAFSWKATHTPRRMSPP